MLPEEQELQRLQIEQTAIEEHVTQAELMLETTRTELAQFQRRYYQTVGKLYVELDALEAASAAEIAAAQPQNEHAQAAASATREQAQRSAEEAGISDRIPDAVIITPELKATYRQACKHMHPDRATSEPERLRRTDFMARVNVAYESGDDITIQKLLADFGADPEAVTGSDVGTQMIKAIRRIAQLRRRAAEIATELATVQSGELVELMRVVEEAERLGGDPLGELAQQLMTQISERKITGQLARNLN